MRASHCGQSGRSGSILCPQATEFRFCNAGALGRVPRSISACTPHGSFFRRRPPEPLLISIQTIASYRMPDWAGAFVVKRCAEIVHIKPAAEALAWTNVLIPMISPGCTDLISPRIPR
jgi:hypothetical protein